MNAYKNPYQKFTKQWLGEVKPKSRTFKLFRITGEEHTSDLSLHGEYITHLSKPLIRVKFRVHFTAFFGLWGIMACVYAIWYLVNKKGILVSEWVLLLLLMLIGSYYVFITIRDLDASDRAIESTVYRVYSAENERDDMNKDDETEDLPDDK